MRQDARIDPFRVDEAGIDGQSRHELEPAARGGAAQQLELRPGRLGIDVVDRDRRDAAPVVDPGVEQLRRSLRSGSAAPGAPPRAAGSSRATAIVQSSSSSGGSGASAIFVPGLGAEVLDDHLLHLRAGRGDREQRLEPLLAGLADPDQDPGRERDARLAGEPQRLEAAQPAACRASRNAARRAARAARRSSRSSSPSRPTTGRSSS